ncbi:hypothetical protein C7B65_17900 [Phormidesmis priestleyi ULC007]|uniref:Uncharacterized protein n=1 Tax=Phormidesmis priestleyi ULC007 TaxID=1920490 RepID=A0A2T1DAX0_9CYAN|nr:hypothetical protein [Phormidesmis priestleyi]PSB17672.1 hypothetical protein C7B65_17900 [Phormidesmis priestleyi ULC007]
MRNPVPWGAAALETPGRGGRRNDYLSWDEEIAFLEPFLSDSAQGLLTTIQTIHQAFEQRVKDCVHPTFIDCWNGMDGVN